MVATYRCNTCGKYFYYHGDAAKALGDLIDVKYALEMNGFIGIPGAWKLVHNRAKCCGNPNITPVLMDVLL